MLSSELDSLNNHGLGGKRIPEDINPTKQTLSPMNLSLDFHIRQGLNYLERNPDPAQSCRPYFDIPAAHPDLQTEYQSSPYKHRAKVN